MANSTIIHRRISKMSKAEAPRIHSSMKHYVGSAGKLQIHLRKGGIEVRTPSGLVVSTMSCDEARRLSRLLLSATNRIKYLPAEAVIG